MKPDLYTKAILTIIAILLAVIVCNQYISPARIASAQETFADVQFTGDGLERNFFDAKTGDLYWYRGENLTQHRKLVKLGQPLAEK